ncbi:MAG: aldolase [Lachnospiraceae bacterium]|nr:aldolase [Lachnospiraceae bacterium]
MSLQLMYITNDPQVAKLAENAGVDRIWIDLEQFGKEERQQGMNTVKSNHKISDIGIVKENLSKAEVIVRINPIYSGSEEEINQVLAEGADVIMLPMFKTREEVVQFIDMVSGRAKTMLLLETYEASEIIDIILEVDGIDEIHIGLNDLHLSMNKRFMFELLCDGTVEQLCKKIAQKSIPYGFGGIGRIGYGKVPAEMIVGEHYRLGSSRAILSRTFCNTDEEKNIAEIEQIFKQEIKKIKEYEQMLLHNPQYDYEANLENIKMKVNQILKEM